MVNHEKKVSEIGPDKKSISFEFNGRKIIVRQDMTIKELRTVLSDAKLSEALDRIIAKHITDSEGVISLETLIVHVREIYWLKSSTEGLENFTSKLVLKIVMRVIQDHNLGVPVRATNIIKNIDFNQKK